MTDVTRTEGSPLRDASLLTLDYTPAADPQLVAEILHNTNGRNTAEKKFAAEKAPSQLMDVPNSARSRSSSITSLPGICELEDEEEEDEPDAGAVPLAASPPNVSLTDGGTKNHRKHSSGDTERPAHKPTNNFPRSTSMTIPEIILSEDT